MIRVYFLALITSQIFGLPLPFNQFAYMEARNNLTFRKNQLNQREKIVNIYMQKLKRNEFEQTADHFFPSRPIETEIDNITSRSLYKFLRKLPKGGNLHIHDNQMLDRKKFLEIIFKREPEFSWLYICDKENDKQCKSSPNECNCSNYFLNYFPKNVPKGWLPVKGSNWTIDKIVKKTTLNHILNDLDKKIYPTDSNSRWREANKLGLFEFYLDVILYNRTRFDYLKACLDLSLEENVQLVEFRSRSFGRLYYFDSEFNRVRIEPYEELEMMMQFRNSYLNENRNFINFIFIINELRILSKVEIENLLDESLQLQSKYPDMIRGFDLVGEEDQGHTLLFHSDALMRGFNHSQIDNNSFNLIFHTAETNWPEDLPPAYIEDAVSTLDNIYDSIILRSSRIGHGIGLIKHPELYKHLIERGVAIETCPASNQILGYVSDIRNHPAINFFRSGIPIVLAGDDPGSFGFNELTFDYYLAYMAWGLDLNDLKVIANNSIQYSLIAENLKQDGYDKFERLWNNFIDNVFWQICLEKKNENILQLNISNLLPSFAPARKEIVVSIFGYGFEEAYCQRLWCVFNNLRSEAYIESLNTIKCNKPILVSNRTEKIDLKIQIGDQTYSTGHKFIFLI